MTKPQSPCFGCVDPRSETCHTTCELYIFYEKQVKEAREKRLKQKQMEQGFINERLHRRKYRPKGTKNSGR